MIQARSDESDLLTAREVAMRLRMPVSTVYHLAKTKRLPAVQIGRTWRFRQRDIDTLLNGEDRTGRILVVDDDQTTRVLVRDIMGQRGYEVLCADTAEEGELLLKSGTVPVALVDVRLPGMSGIELVRRFAGDSSVAIILFTGDDINYSYDEAIHEGAADFLLKPVRLEELTLRIERALEIRRMRMAQEKRVGELERMAVADELTGLSHRRPLTARLQGETSRASRSVCGATLSSCD